ncbi:MAG: tryptophan synthase subunit alpha [Elusimicrobia bacterium]|nr:tryptophan synthase subunit alpha [Elusimicrobiota bacterium]
MVNRIDQVFIELKSQGRKALMAYVTGGYPSLPAMDRAVREIVKAGVDLVEIGVPFSDPIADGPTIQFSSQKALEGGITPARLFDWVKTFRRTHETPVVLMTYMNPIQTMGLASFARRARTAGVDGVIVPDLIIEEGGPLEKALGPAGIHLIYLVAPTTPPPRRTEIARRSRGFLYAVSLTGVTGVRRALPKGLGTFIADVRRRSPVPVAVGFGISDAAQARQAAAQADGVIVGSAFIHRMKNREPLVPFVRSLRRALDGA